jgi:NAD(P)-dependent dehydrogenase (short-subunit alcohol dehydrogenase family)
VARIKNSGGRAIATAADVSQAAAVAMRLVKEGITVNAVAPSLIETDMMRGKSGLVRNIPLGRMGQPDEVAQSVLMVIGNDYMTGQTIPLSGGMAFIHTSRHGVGPTNEEAANWRPSL